MADKKETRDRIRAEETQRMVSEPATQLVPPPTSSVRLSKDQIEALRVEAEKYKVAQQRVTKALGVLWNAQLDMAIFTGRGELFMRSLRKPIGLWDDCSCGCGPGPQCW